MMYACTLKLIYILTIYFIHSFVVFNKKVDYHDPPTVSLSPMAMKERLFCHAHPISPD